MKLLTDLGTAGQRLAGKTLLSIPPVRRSLAAGRTSPIDGRLVDETIAGLLGLNDRMHRADPTRRTPAAARADARESVKLVDAPAPSDVAARDLVWVGPAGSMAARLYAPDGLDAPGPGIVYLHGGGWVICDLDTHDSFCRQLARLGRVRVVSIEYRLAPEHRFPAAADDAVAAFRWVAANAALLGIDPARLGVAGDSAGGNLTALVALETRADAVRPALQVPIYPAVDATRSSRSHATLGDKWFLTRPMIDWYLEHYTGGDTSLHRNPRLSPIFAEDVSGAPPALVYTAGFDPLRDEGHAWAKKLRDAGVVAHDTCFDDLIHGFAQMGGVSPSARAAIERIARETGDALRSVRR